MQIGPVVDDDKERERERLELRARIAAITKAGSAAVPLNEALEVLYNDNAPAAVRRAVLSRPDMPEHVIREAWGFADPGVRAHAIRLRGTPVEQLLRAAADEAWEVRTEVASHSRTPVEVLTALVLDPSSVVRRTAMKRPEVPRSVLVDVVVHGKSRLDAEIAVRQDDFDITANIDRLMEAGDHGAGALLEYADLPTALLRRYAQEDHSASVRALALRRGAPRDVAVPALLSSPHESVRLAAIAGGKCPSDALAQAAADTSDEVRAALAGHEVTPTTTVDLLLTDLVDSVRLEAAGSHQASPKALARAVRSDPSADVRNAAVMNPQCLPEAVLAGCADVDVVVVAAANPACPPEGLFLALVTLRDEERDSRGLDDESPAARRAADVSRTVKQARRRLAPRAWSWLCAQNLTELSDDDLSTLLTRHLPEASGDPRAEVRRAVAAHRDVDDATLLMLSTDTDDQVRLAVTQRILGAAGGAIR